MTLELRGPRITLREVKDEDVLLMQTWLQDDGHRRGYFGGDQDNPRWISMLEALAPARELCPMFAGVDESQRVVSFVSFKPNYPLPWIWEGEAISDPKLQGRGYGYESFALGLRFALAQDGVHKIAGPIPDDNPRSQQVVERLGFSQEGVLQAHFLRAEGGAVDGRLYALLKSAWVDPYLEKI